MDYEAFAARAKSAFDDCSEMKRMLWNMQGVVGAVPDMVRKNERLDRENAELKQENEALKAELDDWKGNAEGFEPDAYMRLPVDADGVPIRIGDTVWYVGDDLEIEKSEPQEVVGLVSVFAADGIYIMTRDYTDKATRPKMLTHKQPEPPDSWEKLLGDLDRATNCEISACCYASNAEKPCKSCKFNRWSNCVGHIFADIADRIRTLMEER